MSIHSRVRYEWEPAPGGRNLEAHEGELRPGHHVLSDDFALTREDVRAEGEQRFVTLGLSDTGNLLVIVYTYREPDSLRVISAWKANRRQRLGYEKNRS